VAFAVAQGATRQLAKGGAARRAQSGANPAAPLALFQV